MHTINFEHLLKQTIGLDATTIGPSSVPRALQERQRACGSMSLEDYWARVQSDKQELKALVEAVVVPETWFFRHPEALATMSRAVQQQLLSRGVSAGSAAADPARLLSLPCSTGEEPLSMAMALLDAGCDCAHFQIDAVDVSDSALAKAREAQYGQNSFRGNSLGFRARYCEAVGGRFLVTDAVRGPVTFRYGNLLDSNLPAQLTRYDVIFCRNLLIYFSEATQKQAVKALAGLLKKNGLLFVGPAEAGILLKHGWVSLRVPHAFGFSPPTHVNSAAAVSPPVVKNSQRNVERQPREPTPKKPVARLPAAAQEPPVRVAPPSHVALQQAQLLADQGRLEQAEKLCQELIQTSEPAAEAFYLLGLVNDASGRSAAADTHYRKALYLDPHHLQALVHLAALLEARGDRTGANRLRERAKRTDDAKRTQQHD